MLILLLACSGSDKESKATEPAYCTSLPLSLPSPRGEVGGGWDETNQRFIFFGGDEGIPENCSSQTSFSNETWAFYPECNNFELVAAATAPAARGRFASAVVGSVLYVHGGRYRDGTSGNYTLYDDLWAFDYTTSTWTQVGSGGPSARGNHTMTAIGGKLYVYGGNTSTDGLSYNPQSDLWSFDPATNQWTEISGRNDPGGRLFHAAAGSDTTLYVFGGGDENAFTGPFFSDVWAYDIASGAWSELHSGGRDAPMGMIWSSLILHNNKLVMFGGHDDGSLGNSNGLWSFDLTTNTWSMAIEGDIQTADANGFCDFPADFTTPDITSPERRNAHAFGQSVDTLYIFGGKTDCGIINDLWSLDLNSNTWTSRSLATYGESCTRAYEDCTTLCY